MKLQLIPFAVFLMVSCLSPGDAGEKPNYPWLKKLNDRIVLDADVIQYRAGMLTVTDINKLKVRDEVVERCLAMKDSSTFRAELIKLLAEKSSDLGIYALLNQLFPDQKLVIPVAEFTWEQPDLSIRFRTDTHVASILVTRETYFRIVSEYWTTQLLKPSTDIDRLSNWCITHNEAKAQKKNPSYPDFPDFRTLPPKKTLDK